MSGKFDPYNGISYLELNKKRWDRQQTARVEDRYQKPAVKKIYLWRNGDDPKKKPKLYIWRQWQSPSLSNLLEEAGPFVGLNEPATVIYDINGTLIEEADEIVERGLYFVTGDEALEPCSLANEHERPAVTPAVEPRHTSMSAPEYSASRNSYYSNLPGTPPPRPLSSHLPSQKAEKPQKEQKKGVKKTQFDDMDEYQRFYEDAVQPSYSGTRYRSQSSNDAFDESRQTTSEFFDAKWQRQDRTSLEKHKTQNVFRARSNSRSIFNRRDQTHPEVYIIYVFLNGHGMESQYLNFTKRQLEKGMYYVLELVARRYNVNPSRLCDMDGKKVGDVSKLMSRGAYILVPAGQQFRDTWYFLPDNAIDTSTNKQRVEDRSAQRDRMIQKKERREQTKSKMKKSKGNVK